MTAALVLFVLLLIVAGPITLLVAFVALLLYPLVWLLLLPFRIVGIAVNGVLDTLRAVVGLPGRLLDARPHP